MNDIVRKLTSRKFWLAAAGIVTGLAVIFGAETSEISTVAGAVTAVASAITYIVVEGKVDAESVRNAMMQTQEAVDTIQETVVTGFGGDEE